MEIWVVTFQTQAYKLVRDTFTKKVILIEEKSDIWKSINFSMKKFVKKSYQYFPMNAFTFRQNLLYYLKNSQPILPNRRHPVPV